MKQKLILTSLSVGAVMFVFSYGEFNHNYSFFQRESVKQERIVVKIVEYIQQEGVSLSKEDLRQIAKIIYKESKFYQIDYRLMLAIIKVESNFRHKVVSPKGARGLLQVKPSLAKFIAKDAGVSWNGEKTLDEPEKNIKIGLYFFSKLLEDFDNLNLALHAYNIGPTKLREIIADKNKPNKHFSTLVLKEYNKIKTILPAP